MNITRINPPIRQALLIVATLTTAVCQPVYSGIVSSGGKLAREIAGELAEQTGRKASREFIETTSVQLEKIASKCGNEALDVIEKNGLAAFRVFQAAGDDAGPYLVNAIRAYGDDAIRIAQTTAGRTVLRSGSETAIRAVARHTDATIPLIRQYGDNCARALTQISPANGRRLIQMVDEESLKSGDFQSLMGTIEKYGDKAMDFIWRHRKVLTSATLLTAFVNDPEPYLNGIKQLAEVAASPMKQFFKEAAESINWNLWVGIVILMGGLWLFFYRKSPLLNHRNGKKSKS